MQQFLKAGSLTILAQSALLVILDAAAKAKVQAFEFIPMEKSIVDKLNNLFLKAPAVVQQLLKLSQEAKDADHPEDARRLGWAARQLFIACQEASVYISPNPMYYYQNWFDLPQVGTVELIPQFAIVSNGLAPDQVANHPLVVAHYVEHQTDPLPVLLGNGPRAYTLPGGSAVPNPGKPIASVEETAAFLRTLLPNTKINVEYRYIQNSQSTQAAEIIENHSTKTIAKVAASRPSSSYSLWSGSSFYGL